MQALSQSLAYDWHMTCSANTPHLPLAPCPAPSHKSRRMLLWREKIPADWLPKILGHLPEILIDHAHLERKAATTALNLEKYADLFPRVSELNAIAIEELQHFELVLALLKKRGIAFGQPFPSPWISGLMRGVRKGTRPQVIDHLICCSLIEGRSCEKFQILGRALGRAAGGRPNRQAGRLTHPAHRQKVCRPRGGGLWITGKILDRSRTKLS